MTPTKKFTVVETYYHVQGSLDGDSSVSKDYLFTKRQLAVAHARAAEKLPIAAQPTQTTSNLPAAAPTSLLRWFYWSRR